MSEVEEWRNTDASKQANTSSESEDSDQLSEVPVESATSVTAVAVDHTEHSDLKVEQESEMKEEAEQEAGGQPEEYEEEAEQEAGGQPEEYEEEAEQEAGGQPEEYEEEAEQEAGGQPEEYEEEVEQEAGGQPEEYEEEVEQEAGGDAEAESEEPSTPPGLTNGRADATSPSSKSTTGEEASTGAGEVATEATSAQDAPNEVTAPLPPPLQPPSKIKPDSKKSANRCQLMFNSETKIRDGFAALLERVGAANEGSGESGKTTAPQLTGQFVVENLFFLLVGGPFDQENNFVISGPDVIPPALEIIDRCPQPIQSEVWGTLAAILRKNKRSLMVCCEAGLIQQAVARLPSAGSGPLADFLIDIIECLVSFSVSVKEFKLLFGLLKAKNGCLNSHYVKLLEILRQLTARTGPDEFFSFPGKKGSAISIPPISKWPYQNGWTFHCWFNTDPPSDSSIERDKPHLFCFRTDKGMGYSGHFIGNALIITVMKMKGKGFQHSIRYDFVPRKWHMLTVVFVYNRWSKSEIRTYVNGTLVTQTELSWVVTTSEPFDRCFIGSASRLEADCMFSGQISVVYGFAEALSPQQIAGVYALGPAYKGQFKFESEQAGPHSQSSLSGAQKTVLYRPDSRLHSSIMFTYNPVACDGQLCLEQSPKVCGQPLQPSVFVHSGHALMTGEARAVCTHSIFSTLHSLGGVQIFLPLFGQLSSSGGAGGEPTGGQEVTSSDICASLLALLADLLQASPSIQQQFMQNKGFLVISQYLTKESLTDKVLDEFVKMTKQLAQNKSAISLVKQLFDHVLFNPTLWIKAPVQVQIRLYKFLATDFVTSVGIFNSVRRVSAVLQTIHTLKHYYWIVHPQDRSGYAPKSQALLLTVRPKEWLTRDMVLEGEWIRADIHDLTTIRASLLIYIKQLILRGNGILDDEMQAILNYLSTVNEDDNLRDVLYFAVTLMAEHPSSMVPAFDRKHAIRTVLKLLASHDEKIRIHALKFLGFFLMRSTTKRKQDVLTTHNLFSLIGERLMLFSPCVTMASYNALFELLTERVTLFITDKRHPEPEPNFRLENPLLLKVIAQLIRNVPTSGDAYRVKKLFLNDLTILCNQTKENRRTMLQMSVWQDWLFGLATFYPQTAEEQSITDLVMSLFRMLLHHAIKYEFGGWRVWIDTLAILHSKVSQEDFRRKMSQSQIPQSDHAVGDENQQQQQQQQRGSESGKSAVEDIDLASPRRLVTAILEQVIDEAVEGGDGGRGAEAEVSGAASTVAKPQKLPESASQQQRQRPKVFSPGPRAAPFRIPEFSWSYLHQKLLNDLLYSVESDLNQWRSHSSKSILDFVNAPENHIYVINLIHLVSQLADTLVTSCGGLLPLLAAATSPNCEVDMLEPGQGLRIDDAVGFLLRVMSITDIVVFATSHSFAELEAEKNMTSGGILRQCLRLVCTCAVRNCLECRYKKLVGGGGGVGGGSGSGGSTFLTSDEVKQMLAGVRKAQQADSHLQVVQNGEMLLQEMDVNRLRAVVYRDVEETKQAQFLALAVAYFVSVLMVSKYRDVLEPPTPLATPSVQVSSDSLPTLNEAKAMLLKRRESSANGSVSEEHRRSAGAAVSSSAPGAEAADSFAANDDDNEDAEVGAGNSENQGQDEGYDGGETGNAAEGETPTGDGEGEGDDEKDGEVDGEREGEAATPGEPIASIQLRQSEQGSRQDRPSSLRLPHQFPVAPATAAAAAGNDSLTQRLEAALSSAAPLLREIFIDFSGFLSKTLIGSHGQELLVGGLVTLKESSSVVELVMLLCSQEWQNSLQKHAGLAFIELVNEGRILSHATRDHIVRVANEAEFILNRMRAEDVQKHADFEQICAQTSSERREEEKLCDHLITSARQRDSAQGVKIREKVYNTLCNRHGPWGSPAKERLEFYRLDSWEDDSRRRRRLVPNAHGSTHPEAALKAAMEHGASPEVVQLAREAVAACRSASKLREDGHGVTDEELMTAECESETDLPGPVALSISCLLLAPGVHIVGQLSVTKAELYFEMDADSDENKKLDEKVLRYIDHLHGKWHFNEIRAIFSRRYLHKNVALEIFMANRSAVMFAFEDQESVKKVVNSLPRIGIGIKYGLQQTRKSSLALPRQIFKLSNMTQKWQRREISNFDYLMYLNTVAGRTFNDLNQYPIFPWVISNYDCSELDLSLPTNYRDLSKPIGALNPSRKAFFDERYASWDDDSQPAFHYGTHYSTSAFVLNYLIRLEPFTSMFLNLQGGKFDHADRIFHSVATTWKNCQRDTSDVKELIPEFYYLPDMFENRNRYQLGLTDAKQRVDDVLLPPWAKTAEDFVRLNRMALESEFVSCQLHQWIDLIFGYKQRGPEAERATNVFYYLTYEGSVDWAKVADPVTRRALEDQIKSFGQTPSQLLTEPHPPRNSALHCSPLMFAPMAEEVCMMMKFLSNSPLVSVHANTHPAVPVPAVTTISANHAFAINRWNNAAAVNQAQVSPAPTYVGQQSATGAIEVPVLPLSLDPLVMSLNSAKRHLGDNFDQRIKVRACQFAMTPDNKILFACGYWDKSFRVYSTDTGKIIQVIFGHFGIVKCLARSECNFSQDCYVVTGSTDCTLLLWLWSSKSSAIVGDSPESPAPKATLTGHQEEITVVAISAELGIIVSGSKDGLLLMHTTHGELIRSLDLPPGASVPDLISINREGVICVKLDDEICASYTLNGKLMRYVNAHDRLEAMILSRCGQYVITAGDSGTAEVRRTHDLAAIYAFPVCDSPIRSLALTHDQKFLLAGMSTGCLIVFNIDFNRWHHEFQERYA